MGNTFSTPDGVPEAPLEAQTESPIVITDARFVISKPVTLSIQTGVHHSKDNLYVSDVATDSQYFRCESAFTRTSCFRTLYDANDACIIASHPHDINGKTYQFFLGGDPTASAVAEANTEKLDFEHMLFMCQISTPSGNVFLFVDGNWRKKNASVYLNKLHDHTLDHEIKDLSIPIARIRPAQGSSKGKPYWVDIAAGIDIAMITALCVTLDGRLQTAILQNKAAQTRSKVMAHGVPGRTS